jgi:hypothetical protein
MSSTVFKPLLTAFFASQPTKYRGLPRFFHYFGLEAVARRLCSKSDFKYSERKPRWMLSFSCKPSKRHFKNFDGSNTDVGVGISTFPDDDGEQGSDPEVRHFRNILCIQTDRSSMMFNTVTIEPGSIEEQLFSYLRGQNCIYVDVEERPRIGGIIANQIISAIFSSTTSGTPKTAQKLCFPP